MQKSKVECLIEVFYLKADGAYQYVCMSQDEGKIREKEGDIEIESCLFFSDDLIFIIMTHVELRMGRSTSTDFT